MTKKLNFSPFSPPLCTSEPNARKETDFAAPYTSYAISSLSLASKTTKMCLAATAALFAYKGQCTTATGRKPSFYLLPRAKREVLDFLKNPFFLTPSKIFPLIKIYPVILFLIVYRMNFDDPGKIRSILAQDQAINNE